MKPMASTAWSLPRTEAATFVMKGSPGFLPGEPFLL